MAGIIDFHRIIKRSGLRVDNTKVAYHSFFVLQGIFAGIALNDIWRILNLPGNATPINVAGVPSTFHQDYLFQVGIAGVSALAEVIGGIDHGLAFAMGIFLGSTWANSSEAGNYIGGAAANAAPKINQAAPTPQVVNPIIIQQPSYAPSVSPIPFTPTQSTYNPYANAIPNAPHLGLT